MESPTVRIDSEIAITALLATAVTTFTSSWELSSSIAIGAGLGLLTLTLFRRLALIRNIPRESSVVSRSGDLLILMSELSVIYLLFRFSHFVSKPLSFVGQNLLFLLFAALFAVGAAILEEILLSSFIQESVAMMFRVQTKNRTLFSEIVIKPFRRWFSLQSLGSAHGGRQAELTEFSNEGVKGDELQEAMIRPQLNQIVVVISVLGAFLTYSMIALVGSIVFPVGFLMAFGAIVAATMVRGTVSIFYSAYGLYRAGGQSWKITFTIELICYIYIGALLF